MNQSHHIVPQGTYVQVVHLHPGNSSRSRRKGSKYMTIAKLIDAESKSLLLTSTAKCSSRDDARRHIGREVAVGRVLADWWYGVEHYEEEEGESDRTPGSLG